MSYTIYYPTSNYPVASHPPRSYAREPSLEYHYDTKLEDFMPEHGMFGDSTTSGYGMAPLAGPSSTMAMSDEEIPHSPYKPSHAETEAYLRRNLGIPPPRPVNLSSVPNGRTPTVTEMIKLAIWGSPEKRLTLSQIYAAIEERYPEKRCIDPSKKPAWQRSIRHNLSLKNIFVKESRPNDHPGKGSYWYLDIRNGEGTRRSNRSDDLPPEDLASEEESTNSSTPSARSSPEQRWAQPNVKTESPQPDMPPFARSDSAMIDRLGHMNLEGRSSYHGGVGYHGYLPPPHAVNPRMTMGDYTTNNTLMPGSSLPPLPGRQGDMQLHMIPEGLPMHPDMQPLAGPSRTHQPMPMPMFSRRRTYAHSGLEDEEGSARGVPKPRRNTD